MGMVKNNVDQYKSYHCRRFDVLIQEQCRLGFQRREMVTTPGEKGVGRRMINKVSDLTYSNAEAVRIFHRVWSVQICVFFVFVIRYLMVLWAQNIYTVYCKRSNISGTHKIIAIRLIKV